MYSVLFLLFLCGFGILFLLLTMPAISIGAAEGTQTLVIPSTNVRTVDGLYFVEWGIARKNLFVFRIWYVVFRMNCGMVSLNRFLDFAALRSE